MKKLSTEVKKGWEIKKKRRLGKSDTIVEMKGRLRGASKASKLKSEGGRRLYRQSHGRVLRYSYRRLYTRWGHIGIKI